MSETEKQFMEVFEIKPNLDYFVSFIDDKTKIVRFFHCNKEELLYIYKYTKYKLKVLRVDFDYPQITERILLKLVALCQRKTYDEYKNECLIKTIKIMGENVYKISQVQALFKENN